MRHYRIWYGRPGRILIKKNYSEALHRGKIGKPNNKFREKNVTRNL